MTGSKFNKFQMTMIFFFGKKKWFQFFVKNPNIINSHSRRELNPNITLQPQSLYH